MSQYAVVRDYPYLGAISASTAHRSGRRSGPDTRAAIQRVAFQLFTAQGYEATTMREIADAVGIKKASLYYHFAGKEEILRSLFDQRGDEAERLLDWIAAQPQSGELPKVAVLRWIDSFSAEKLRQTDPRRRAVPSTPRKP